MTDEQRNEEGAEEAIEDLEAPAAVQSDVAGGKGMPPTYCALPSERPKCTDNSRLQDTKQCSVTVVVK